MRTEQNMNINQWEDLCEGTYPGYGDTETEARAYAALAEVLDESSIPDVMQLLYERMYWPAHDPAKLYELDRRIIGLVKLLLHHGWQPPRHTAYTLVETDSSEPAAPGNRIMPHEEEHLDYGAAMEALSRDS